MAEATYDLGTYTQWGYLSQGDTFVERQDEAVARKWVSWAKPGVRKLAKREVGPIELVDPHTVPWPEVKAKKAEIDAARESGR